jgi:hypothetical protein
MRGQQAGTEQGEAVLARAVAAYQAAFGSRMMAGYALGSLAHGGFSALVSDVDLGLILRDPPRVKDRLTIRAVARAVRADGAGQPELRPLLQRLSVFWGTPATLQGRAGGGRFPPLDRLDLLEHGRLLAGRDAREGVPRPGQDELLVAGAEFALRTLGGAGNRPGRLRGRARPGDALGEIRDPPRLVSRGPGRLTKVVLFPVRFLFTAATGQVATNALAAEHYLAGPPAPGTELVAAALAWREQPPADEAAAIALLSRELIPLYTHYLDDHIARLSAAGHDRLAGRFRAWRARLAA